MHVDSSDGRLFLDVRGRHDAPPLLYLHGGPGMGCHEFMTWQGDRLADGLRLIGLDQRGVLRSDPLDTDQLLTESDLVADCESLRTALGIRQWTVLGHSFGGRVALRYARAHPDRVSTVIFENPAWDITESDRLKLPVAARLFAEAGDEVSAARCHLLLAGASVDRWEAVELLSGLHGHGRYYDLFAHQPHARQALRQLDDINPFPPDWQARGDTQARRLLEAPDVLSSMVPLLSGLAVPALLIKGQHDLVTGPGQLQGFQEQVTGGQLTIFPNSGHFVQLEEPEDYASTVRDFVATHDR